MHRHFTKLSPVRMWMLGGIAVVCIGLHIAGLRTRMGVTPRGGVAFYILPIDGVDIDSLNTRDPGPKFTALGFEFKSFTTRIHTRGTRRSA